MADQSPPPKDNFLQIPIVKRGPYDYPNRAAKTVKPRPATTATTEVVEHHFANAHQQHEAATLGMWTFLATEVALFRWLLLAYAIYRYGYERALIPAAAISRISLAASTPRFCSPVPLTMALAGDFAHARAVGRRRSFASCSRFSSAWLSSASNSREYYSEYHDHLIPAINFIRTPRIRCLKHVELFMVFYFFLTLLHATHMLIGIGLLTYLALTVAAGAS